MITKFINVVIPSFNIRLTNSELCYYRINKTSIEDKTVVEKMNLIILTKAEHFQSFN